MRINDIEEKARKFSDENFFSRLCVEILYFVDFVSQYPVDYCEQTRPAGETSTFFFLNAIYSINLE